MSGMNNNPLLSICIPTWNRCTFLKESLNRLLKECSKINQSEVEILISDNCSSDDTEKVVNNFVCEGFPIIYNRNSENLGAAYNFLICMKQARGKYIILLGDDDFLCDNALSYILNLIRGKDYGLIHICRYPKEKKDFWEFNNVESFLKKVSFWITFMSGNIFRKDIVETIRNPERYIPTRLLQVPFFLTSALNSENNLVINNKNLMQIGVDVKSNGGYNPYEIFVRNYLNIWNEYKIQGKISDTLFSYIKKDLYMNFLLQHNIEELILKKNVVTNESSDNLKSRNGYKIMGAKLILKEYYGRTWYYYTSAFVMMWKVLNVTLKGIVKIYLCRE